jgi:hypothetical protein
LTANSAALLGPALLGPALLGPALLGPAPLGRSRQARAALERVGDPSMNQCEHEFIAYRIGRQSKMGLAPAPWGRDWMNQTNRGFANRCLPMRMASQAGWVIINDRPLRAKWRGHAAPNSLVIECQGDPPYGAISHFGEGILTFIIPFLFRTPPGWALLFRGPANMPKDAIAPLEGLVETDWAVASASVNWKFTRADAWVEFAQGETICMIVPQKLDQLEAFRPRIVDIEKDPETLEKYRAWHGSNKLFAEKLKRWDPDAIKQGWQKYYFRGTAPHAGSNVIPEAGAHRVRVDLRDFLDVNCEKDVAARPITDPTKNSLGL